MTFQQQQALRWIIHCEQVAGVEGAKFYDPPSNGFLQLEESGLIAIIELENDRFFKFECRLTAKGREKLTTSALS